MYNLRNELMHYTNDLPDGADLKAEAVAVIEQIARYMEKDVLLHHSRPLALAYLALTEEADSVPVVHGVWACVNKIDPISGYRCSKCRHIVGFDLTPYCPNCGAKMDGGDSNEAD